MNLCKLYVLVISLTISTNALAYLDPGSAGLFVQLLLGGCAGFLVVIKTQWITIKQMIRSIFRFGKQEDAREKGDMSDENES